MWSAELIVVSGCQSGGRLRRPLNVPVDIFADELEFYDLGDDVIDKFRADEGLSSECAGDEQLPVLPQGQFRRAVWLLFEYPESSSAARAVAILSVSVILLSIATFCLETLPQFKQYRLIHGAVTAAADDGNATSTVIPTADQSAAVAIVEEDDIPAFDEPLFVIETICVVWFTSEVSVRFAAAPDHLAFFRSPMNVIDVVSIVPYFITLSTIIADATSENLMSSVANNQVLETSNLAENKLYSTYEYYDRSNSSSTVAGPAAPCRSKSGTFSHILPSVVI